jgi:Co/Zn/Cd efflux system component
MADSCCAPPTLELGPKKQNRAYRRVLFTVLAINAVMFGVEVIAGVAAGSASLQADALDFLGDATNYAIDLLVVGMALHYRASAALAKGLTMGLFGLWVILMLLSGGNDTWPRMEGGDQLHETDHRGRGVELPACAHGESCQRA